MRVKANPPLTVMLTLLGLFVSAIIIPFEYEDCESLFQDENPDPLSTRGVVRKQSHASHFCTFITSPSALRYFLSPHHLVVAFFSTPINSHMTLAANLRC